MANLKDINYGIGKYLELSDASAIPDIGTNRKNIDLLNFKVATNNAYDLYNFKDGMIDAYQTQDGVDTSGSTNDSYDSTNKVYQPATTSAKMEIFTQPATWLQFDGSDGSTTFTESGLGNPNGAWGANGNAQLDTAQKKFGTASLLLDGSGDYLTSAWNRRWGGWGNAYAQRRHFVNYNFTIEMWVRFASLASYQTFWYQGNGTAPEYTFDYSTANGLRFLVRQGSSYWFGGANGLSQGGVSGWSTNTWYHIAVTRFGDTWNLWRDGVSLKTVTESAWDLGGGSGSNGPIQQAFHIGSVNSGGNPFNGHIDNLKLDFLCRYIDTFTPPTSASEGCSGHSYTAPTGATTAKVLLVAGGGGGGGAYYSGGGGAGGVVLDDAYPVSGGTAYAVTVGKGGNGGPNGGAGTQGQNTVFNTGGTTMTALGGGYSTNSPRNGNPGGSGGGGSTSPVPSSTQPATPSGGSPSAAGYGSAGGGDAGGYGGTGGGGAGGVGGNAGPHESQAGGGGIGKKFPSFNQFGTTASMTALHRGDDNGYFGGGGGGGLYPGATPHWPSGEGGAGGGGPGAINSTPSNRPINGLDGAGGGGGGGTGASGVWVEGQGGGAGFAAVNTPAIQNNMTLISNTQTAQATPTEGRLMLYEEDVDSITLNTDLKGYVSRDGGTTYTQTTLTEDSQYNIFGIDTYNKLLLHCDGSNGGTTFTDSSDSAHTITAVGDSHTDTAIKKFGTAGLQLPHTGASNGDYLYVNPNADWTIGTGDYTWDLWVYFDSVSGTRNIINQNPENLAISYASSNLTVTQANTAINFAWTPSTGTWYHVAVTRASGSLRAFIDGTQIGSTTSATQNITGTGGNSYLYIGSPPGGAAQVNQFYGSMDEIRFSNGIARWTANFTSPNVPYGNPQRMLSGSVDISGQPSGTNMKYKVETLNRKNLKLHGASLLWA